MPSSRHIVLPCASVARALRWLGGFALLSALFSAAGSAQARPAPRATMRALSSQVAARAADAASAVGAVVAFREALAKGDSTAVLALLAPDVVVVESGDVERLADYRRHHLPADIDFARAIPGVHTLVSAHADGNTAWVTSTSLVQGQFHGRSVNTAGAELIVLTRDSAGAEWRIRAIHWSSHRRAA